MFHPAQSWNDGGSSGDGPSAEGPWSPGAPRTVAQEMNPPTFAVEHKKGKNDERQVVGEGAAVQVVTDGAATSTTVPVPAMAQPLPDAVNAGAPVLWVECRQPDWPSAGKNGGLRSRAARSNEALCPAGVGLCCLSCTPEETAVPQVASVHGPVEPPATEDKQERGINLRVNPIWVKVPPIANPRNGLGLADGENQAGPVAEASKKRLNEP